MLETQKQLVYISKTGNQKIICQLLRQINLMYKKLATCQPLQKNHTIQATYQILKQLLNSRAYYFQEKSIARIIIRIYLLLKSQDQGKQNKKLLENCIRQIYLKDSNFMSCTQGSLTLALKIVLGIDANKYLNTKQLSNKIYSQNKDLLKEMIKATYKNEELTRDQLSQSTQFTCSNFNQSRAFPLHNPQPSIHCLPKQKFINCKFLQIDLTQDQQANEDQTKRKIIGILNSGGGYLLVRKRYCSKSNRSSYEYLNLWMKKVKNQITDSIFPKQFQIKAEQVNLNKTKSNFINEDNALLLTIQPKSHLLYFLIKSKTTPVFGNYQPVFLNSSDSQNDNTFVLKESPETYSIMLQIYEKSMKKRKKSEFCICKSMQEKISQNNELRKSIIQEIKLTSDADEKLALPYKLQAMFIVGSQDTQIYKKFIKNLTSNKINFVISSPFMKYRNNSNKLIAIVSHENSFENIFSLAKKSAGSRLKALISIYPNVFIPQIVDQLLKDFQNIFEQKYGERLVAFRCQSEDQMGVFLCFKNCEQSIFCFCVLQNWGRRCEFVKKNKCEIWLKNKSKINQLKGSLP